MPTVNTAPLRSREGENLLPNRVSGIIVQDGSRAAARLYCRAPWTSHNLVPALPMTIFMPKSLRTVRVMGAFVMASLLAACTSTADIRAADTYQCRSYGFRPGTDAFSQCLLDVDLNRAAERRALLNRPHFGVGFGYGFGPRRNWW